MPTPLDYSDEQAYLAEALQHIQRHSIRQDRILDFWAFHDRVLEFAGDPEGTAETYPAIRFALEQLCDNHSFLLEPKAAARVENGRELGFGLTVIYPERVVIEVLSGSPAAKAGVLVGDRVELVNDHEPVRVVDKPYVDLGEDASIRIMLQPGSEAQRTHLTLQEGQYGQNPVPSGRRLPDNIGYIEITRFLGEGEAADRYASALQQTIRDIDHEASCGWVVDLRRNSGGNLWPMLAGAAPILGGGWVGSLIDNEGRVTRWMLRPDGLWLAGERVVELSGNGYRLKRSSPPVVVLTSKVTGSAGEGVVVAFLGRKNTLVLGEMTAGVASANRGRQLSDGAMLFVASAWFADTTGQVYAGKLVPDRQIRIDWTRFGSEEDPVLSSALTWLLSQPACQA